MIYLPWLAFLGGIAWMIWQANKAKKEYLRRKADEDSKTRRAPPEDDLVRQLGTQGQGQAAELARTFGGGAQRGPTRWN